MNRMKWKFEIFSIYICMQLVVSISHRKDVGVGTLRLANSKINEVFEDDVDGLFVAKR